MSLLNCRTKTRKLIWAFLYLSARIESSNPLKVVRNIIIDIDLKHPDGKTYEVNWITEKLKRNRFIINK